MAKRRNKLNELVPVFQAQIGQDKVDCVDARILHERLEVKSPFHIWISRRLKDNNFVENKDYSSTNKIVHRDNGANLQNDYHLALDTAKHISLMERNQKGYEMRSYFIEVENELARFSKQGPIDLLPHKIKRYPLSKQIWRSRI